MGEGGGFSRRRFVAGVAAAGAAGAAIPVAVALGRSDPDSSGGRRAPSEVEPFHGPHQAGITSAPQPQAIFAAFDATVASADRLAAALAVLSTRARSLVTGTPASPTDGLAASGVVGAAPGTGGLTITVALGASVFDDRFGLADRRPHRLVEMPAFANDQLEPEASHGDLLLQIGADDLDTCLHALRDLSQHVASAFRPRWRIDGFVPPPRPAGAPRNLMGFKDGTAQPADGGPGALDRLVWVAGQDPEPGWTAGGTYLVVRVIRMLLDSWERIGVPEQERIIGRDKVEGAPLGQTSEADVPDFTDDPDGRRVPLTSHIRRANPRTPETADQDVLRRSFSFDRPDRPDLGLVFCCFQQDVERQFATIQRRLDADPLAEYVQPIGGGYFFVLPGVVDADDVYGRALFA